MSRAWALGSLGRKIAQNYCVFVGNLSWTVSRGELQECFEKFGRVRHARIITDEAGFSRGYGFVTFTQRESYESALSQPSMSLQGQLLTVAPVKRRIKGQGTGTTQTTSQAEKTTEADNVDVNS